MDRAVRRRCSGCGQRRCPRDRAAARAVEPGQMVAIKGTLTCHVMNATELHEMPGMSSCGVRVTWVISTKVLGSRRVVGARCSAAARAS